MQSDPRIWTSPATVRTERQSALLPIARSILLTVQEEQRSDRRATLPSIRRPVSLRLSLGASAHSGCQPEPAGNDAIQQGRGLLQRRHIAFLKYRVWSQDRCWLSVRACGVLACPFLKYRAGYQRTQHSPFIRAPKAGALHRPEPRKPLPHLGSALHVRALMKDPTVRSSSNVAGAIPGLAAAAGERGKAHSRQPPRGGSASSRIPFSTPKP